MSVFLSVVIPCLNEADTLSTVLRKVHKAMTSLPDVTYELIVADNGSTDGSIDIAKSNEASVVHVETKGYGAALMSGIEAAVGEWIVMGDADDSYDFLELPKFINQMETGVDIVHGCRMPTGGGTIAPGAMPWSHRYIGNPMFSFLTRTWFRAPIHDVYCGMRGFRKDAYLRLRQRCTGMEFATEMIIKASLFGLSFREVPITLHKDGRIAHPPHLRTMRDGWRTLRFFLLCSPNWLFFVPGVASITLGLVAAFLGFSKTQIGGIHFDLNTLLCGCFMVLIGFQSVLFALMSKTYAINNGILPDEEAVKSFFEIFTLEKTLICASVVFIASLIPIVFLGSSWVGSGFGNLEFSLSIRILVTSLTVAMISLQSILFGFFTSMLSLEKR